MKITNPTKKDIEVCIFGVDYRLPAEGYVDRVPTKTAEYWKVQLHNFVILEEDVDEAQITKKEEVVVETKVEETKVEEVKEPEVKEAKKESKPKTKNTK